MLLVLRCLQENGYDAAELAEALLLIKASSTPMSFFHVPGGDLLTLPHPTISSPLHPQTRKSQKEIEFLGEVGEGSASLQELRAAHAETIQELQKTRNILNTESNISKHLQVTAGKRTRPASLTLLGVVEAYRCHSAVSLCCPSHGRRSWRRC